VKAETVLVQVLVHKQRQCKC